MDGDESERRPPRRHHTHARGRRSWPGASALDLRQPHEQAAAAILIVGLVLAATVALIVLLNRPGHTVSATPPSPSPTLSIGTSRPSPPANGKQQQPLRCSTPAPSGVGATAPFQICIPELRVDTSMMQLGLNQDRTVQVPPLSRVGDAGWYRYSAEPGAVGPTVVLGHVDSAQYGEGVFYRLGQLRSGNKIIVSRGDGMLATFRVDKVSEVSKRKFPTNAVYGPTSKSTIRLVTCGGKFNSATGNYEDNIIAFGTLQSLRHR
ncbi:MAG: class F sortase [Mycobacteriales bacterium]